MTRIADEGSDGGQPQDLGRALAAGAAFEAAMNRLVESVGMPPDELSRVQEGIVALAAEQGTLVEPSSIRMVGARRMQCKDIPDEAFLEAVRRAGEPGRWRMRWEVQAELETVVGPLPVNLFLAKARKLIAAGKIGGCGCGCRGDYELPDEAAPGAQAADPLSAWLGIARILEDAFPALMDHRVVGPPVEPDPDRTLGTAYARWMASSG